MGEESPMKNVFCNAFDACLSDVKLNSMLTVGESDSESSREL
jgi:hypothetical protein